MGKLVVMLAIPAVGHIDLEGLEEENSKRRIPGGVISVATAIIFRVLWPSDCKRHGQLLNVVMKSG